MCWEYGEIVLVGLVRSGCACMLMTSLTTLRVRVEGSHSAPLAWQVANLTLLTTISKFYPLRNPLTQCQWNWNHLNCQKLLNQITGWTNICIIVILSLLQSFSILILLLLFFCYGFFALRILKISLLLPLSPCNSFIYMSNKGELLSISYHMVIWSTP